jgi:hypothetical protein
MRADHTLVVDLPFGALVVDLVLSFNKFTFVGSGRLQKKKR